MMNKQKRAERLNEMRRLYEEKNWTLKEIGVHFKVTRQAIHDCFKRAGIKCRAFVPKRERRVLDWETLVRLYADENRKISEIAQFFNTDPKKVRDELTRYGIEKRHPGYLQRKNPELHEMKVGDVIQIKPPQVKHPVQNLHCKVYKKGIRIRVERIGRDIFQVTRLK